MALNLSYYPLAAGVVNLTQVNANFNDIAQKFGAIVDADVSASANVSIDKLSAQYQELALTLIVRASDLAAGWPAAGATTPLAWAPIPGTNADTAWVATDVSWVCTDTGDGLGTFDVRYGEYNGVGVWTNTISVVTGVTLANAAVVNDSNDGKALENGSVSLAFAATSRALAIVSAGVSATTIDSARSQLAVTVILRRKIKGAT